MNEVMDLILIGAAGSLATTLSLIVLMLWKPKTTTRRVLQVLLFPTLLYGCMFLTILILAARVKND